MIDRLRKYVAKLKTADKDHKRIARGLFLVSFFILIGKIAGAAKEVAIAYKLGIGELVDLYVLAFTFAIWIPTICVTVINTIYVPLIHKLAEAEKNEFKAQFIGITLILAGISTLVLLWIFPYALEFLSASWAAENKNTIYKLSIGFAPLAGLGMVSATFSAILLAEEHHSNTLLEVVPSLVLAIIVFLWPVNHTIDPLVWGTVIGFAMQTAGLFFLLKTANLSIRPSFALSSRGWATFKKNIGIIFLAQFIMSFVEPAGTIIASTLGSGNVSSLGYSSRILALFLALGAATISRAILPVLSNTHRNSSNSSRLVYQWSLLFFLIGVVGAIFTWIITPQLVSLLLERGAFSAEDSATVTTGVRFGIAQFPFYFPGIVLAQYFISIGHYKLILWSAIIALTVKISFSLILAPLYSFSGIIFASIPMYFCTSLLLLICLIRKRPFNKEDL